MLRLWCDHQPDPPARTRAERRAPRPLLLGKDPTWHAALYAGLCASPGGAGDTDLDRRFAAARRPRPDRGVWRVDRLGVQLDDDTQLEVDHKVADPLGRVQHSIGGLPGFTAQVDTRGGVDLSTLLGLDRRSYAATAWVEQSHPLPVLDQAGDGRNDLQRAVALCIGEDEAARAIQRLELRPANTTSAARLTRTAWSGGPNRTPTRPARH